MSRVFLLCSVVGVDGATSFRLSSVSAEDECAIMEFANWLKETYRVFVQRFGIDHVMGGFARAEMIRDWQSGELPTEWVERIGLKYDLDECDQQGAPSVGW